MLKLVVVKLIEVKSLLWVEIKIQLNRKMIF